MHRKYAKCLVVALCLGLAHAGQAAADRGGYMGATAGTFDYDEGSDDSQAVSDNTTHYQLFGGYRFNDHLATEFGWTRTGDIDDSFDVTFPDGDTFTLNVSAYYDIYSVRAVGFLPLDSMSLFGALGYYSASLNGDVDVAGFGTVATVDGHERGGMISLGLQHDFRLDLKSLSVRGGYDWYDFGSEIDASGFNIGILFRF